VIVVCCQIEVSASGRSRDQKSPTDCGVSECDLEVSIMRRPWPVRGCRAMRVVGKDRSSDTHLAREGSAI
jgi:hypothetical protein